VAFTWRGVVRAIPAWEALKEGEVDREAEEGL